MPVSNFHRVLTAVAEGREVRTAGPLDPPDPDSSSLRVFAVITQPPRGNCAPDPDDPDEPNAVTCHGEVHLDNAQWKSATAAAGPGDWSFDAFTVGGGQFKSGWARATAFALETKLSGDIETYSWSAWVWINRSP